jgi:pimeloyl-ACP methyl ester carboxylesterase
MRLDAIAAHKRVVDVGSTRIAYYDEGQGPPILLLHGCPFSSFIEFLGANPEARP